MDDVEKVKSLGGTIDGGINWTWARFETEAPAREFNKWCGQNGYETRGVYEPDKVDKTWGVRWR